ncbi:hypothetical protein [Oscillatoria sp. FACHB-1406]|uniref:hypothetical protein n=1 Tax=Oscillatoria sp. FACHB-1406 TaxID=2692846 RepID=UPI001687FBFD|nr:hypothetical protein [Oscillatoria sp. FACHB-1406]MBD2578510.1 hypothetical protein [Oscillatoria sp. FACHB-1406]
MIVKKVKSLLQFNELPSFASPQVWLPSVLVPLFALALWGYLENPDWLEATIEENASTGQILDTDPNSPVTEADLSIEQLSQAAQAESISDLLQQLSLPPAAGTASGQQTATEGDAQAQAASAADAKNAAAGNSTKPKPVIEAKNPFASAIQNFLNGGSTSGVTGTRDPLKFAALVSGANAMRTPTENSSLQDALAKLNNPEGAAESGTTNALTSAAASSAVSIPTTVSPIARGQALPVGQNPSSSLVGQGVYIPGQMPSTIPGQLPVTQSGGFVTTTPGAQVYYPQQRGASGYQVTPGGTTYSRERGTTGSIVTPQGIVGPRERGTTGSVVTPQGTVYTRERGSTGFTAPPVNGTSTNTNSTPTTTGIPNNVP